MTVGIIGHGRFGRLAATLIAGHAEVVVHDPATPHSRRRGKVRFGSRAEAAGQPVVLLAVPVSSLRGVLRAIRDEVAPGSIVLDVCAVKQEPLRWMRALLPPSVHVVGTHPLFGPDSYAGTLEGLHTVVCAGRPADPAAAKVARTLRRAGLTVRQMTPDAHDRMMARTVFLTQCVGRIVAAANIAPEAGVTAHYRSLMGLVQVAGNDSPELFRDMWRYNRHARDVLRKLGAGWRNVTRDARPTKA